MLKKEWGKPVITKLDILLTAMSWDEWNKALDSWLSGFHANHKVPTGAEWEAWNAANHYS